AHGDRQDPEADAAAAIQGLRAADGAGGGVSRGSRFCTRRQNCRSGKFMSIAAIISCARSNAKTRPTSGQAGWGAEKSAATEFRAQVHDPRRHREVHRSIRPTVSFGRMIFVTGSSSKTDAKWQQLTGIVGCAAT